MQSVFTLAHNRKRDQKITDTKAVGVALTCLQEVLGSIPSATKRKGYMVRERQTETDTQTDTKIDTEETQRERETKGGIGRD